MATNKAANPYGGGDFFQPEAAPPAPPSRKQPGGGARTVRLNLDLDRDLHRQLKRMALDQDRTLADVVRGLISDAVAKNSGALH